MAERFRFKKDVVESFHVHKADISGFFIEQCKPVFRLIAQPDTHVVHRDFKAVDAFLKFIEWYKPDGHIILGDFIDAEGITHWPNDELRHRDFISEIVEARELLGKIVDITPDCKMRIYLEGNHENWIKQAMAAKMPEFFIGLEKLGLMPDLSALLELSRLGYRLIPMNHIFQIGLANFTHGLYASANHPATHLKRLKANIYYGHLHDELMVHEPSMNGIIEAASLGCLCRLDAKFMKGKPTNWVHGFGIFEFFPDGRYTRTQIRIIDGRFSYNGTIFSSK